MDEFMADILAAKEQKASLLDAAPLCAVKLDSEGKARACNKLFETLMGPLFKYSQYSFAKAAANDEASRKLQEAFDAVCSGDSPRVRLRNIEMLTLAGEAGLPIKAHFDWFIGPGDIKGEVTVFGDPCSEDILEQRAKDAELIDFFQNAPIALHWLSGTGHVMWANQTELDVLGYTAEEYIGQPIMQFCPDEEELVLEIFKTLGSGNIIKDVPVRFRTKAGKIVPLLIDSNVAYKIDEKGEKAFNHTRCFIRDDTGRRVREARVEALLKETDRSLKLLDAFVSRTLHLVKTPCHVVQQSLGLLASNMRAVVGRMPKAEAAFFAETDALLEASMKQLSDVADLINDASDVMRFEQGAVLQTVPVPLPLKVIGRSAVDHVKDLAKPRVRVAFEFEKGPSVASLDAKLLHRALDQLLKNAAEATPEGGSITLKMSPEKESQTGASRVRFEVRDTGCGLKTNDPAKLFSRYSPGGPGRSPQGSPQGTPQGTTPETSNVTTPEGTPHQTPTEGSIEEARKELEDKLSFSAKKATGLGIGLNLTYGLVRAMGGELRADSKPGNTTFWFVLPAGDAHTPAPDERYVATGDQLGPAVPVPDNVGWARGDRMERKSRRKANWNSISRYGEDSSAGEVGGSTTSDSDSTPFPGSSPVMQPRKWEEEVPVKKLVQASEVAGRGLSALDAPHVLVVEDTDMCAMIVCMLLKKLGCSTDHAENGAEALEMLKNAEPGLYSMVLMDLRMPVMDGFEATTAIKEMGLPLPVVALTADEGFDTRDRCFAIGFDDFATKPLHYEELAALIQKHTGHCVCAAPAPSAQAPVATPVLA